MSVISAERLKRWTQIKQKAALKRWLTARGVRFFMDSEGWPITTIGAIQEALDDRKGKTEPNLSACWTRKSQ